MKGKFQVTGKINYIHFVCRLQNLLIRLHKMRYDNTMSVTVPHFESLHFIVFIHLVFLYSFHFATTTIMLCTRKAHKLCAFAKFDEHVLSWWSFSKSENDFNINAFPFAFLSLFLYFLWYCWIKLETICWETILHKCLSNGAYSLFFIENDSNMQINRSQKLHARNSSVYYVV